MFLSIYAPLIYHRHVADLVKGRPLGPEALLLWIYSGLHFSPQHQPHTLPASCHSPSSRIPRSGRTLDHSDQASLSGPAKVFTSLKISDISAGLKSTCQCKGSSKPVLSAPGSLSLYSLQPLSHGNRKRAWSRSRTSRTSMQMHHFE